MTIEGLVLRLDPGCDPIAGEIVDGDGEPQRFTGWLELTNLIERARLGAASVREPVTEEDR